MTARALIAVALLAVFVLARYGHARRRRSLQRDVEPGPDLPARLLGPERTWVVFTTPWCATCGPVTERLREADPGARVVTVDASRERSLAESFHVRTSPTVLLADAGGRVQARLVGAAAVEGYVRSPQ